MEAIAFSSRAGHTANLSNWLSPVQAVFAFFAPPTNSPHAQANQNRKAGISASAPCQTPRTSIQFERHGAFPAVSPIIQTSGFPESSSARLAPSLSKGDRACLKILREFEPGKSRSSTGRLVISGRMADVCAALDRMAG